MSDEPSNRHAEACTHRVECKSLGWTQFLLPDAQRRHNSKARNEEDRVLKQRTGKRYSDVAKTRSFSVFM